MDPSADVVAVGSGGSPARSTSSRASSTAVVVPPKVRRTNIQVCVRVRPLHVDNGDPRTAAMAAGGGSPERRRLRRHPSSMSSSTTALRPPHDDGGGGVGPPSALLPPPRSSPSGLQPPSSSSSSSIGGADAGGVKSRIRPPSRINKLSSRLRRPPSSHSAVSSFGSSPGGEPSPGAVGRLRVDEAASGPCALTESALRRLDDRAGGGGSLVEAGPPSASSASNLAPSRFSSGLDAAPPTRAALPAWECPPGDHTTVRQTPSSHPDPSRKSSYSFDRVYGPNSVTSGIYDESVRDVVESAMEGYHGSVFAYGQTSTGKTFTMTGTERSPGVVPLAVRDCFGYIERGKNSEPHGREYLLRVSYMEIYNEQIHDLLAPASSRASGAIRIFESKSEGVIVRGLKEEVVTNPEQVFALIAQGDARRSTGSTDLNRRSSRSHSIFRLLIESRSRGSVSGDPAFGFGGDGNGEGGSPCGPVRVSSLSLVDLAGSESVKATNATGTRQKEGQFINKSLMTLGHVIWKLSEMSARAEAAEAAAATTKPDAAFPAIHVPYRDSKLTRLLQPSLSGNAQICIVCNISPEMRNLDESHNTLKFASRAKRIKQTAVVTEVVDDKTLLQNYREEIEALKRQLTEAKEAQRALMEERSNAGGSIEEEKKASDRAPSAWGAMTSAREDDEEDDDEDSRALVVAIQNLEKLILKNSGGGGGGGGKGPTSTDRNDANVAGTDAGAGKGGDVVVGESRRDGRAQNDDGPKADPNDSLFSLASNFDALLLDDDDGAKKSSRGAVAASSAAATTGTAGSRPPAPLPLDLFDDDDVAGGDAEAALVSPAAAPRPTSDRTGGNGGGGGGVEALFPDPPSAGPSPIVAGESPAAAAPVGAFDFETPGRNFDNGGGNNGGGSGREEAESTLVSELHRIQGLLGSVLKRKARFGSDRPASFSSSTTSSPPRHQTTAETPLIGTGTSSSSSSAFPFPPPPPPSSSRIAERTPGRAGGVASSAGKRSPFKKRVFQTPKRDQEVESLRRQLEEQEVASSLRKADSNFLQSQLAEKDGLLKEVSKILDAVERRQVELESENARLKATLGRTAAELASRDAEIVAIKTRASLENHDDDDDGGMFDTLL